MRAAVVLRCRGRDGADAMVARGDARGALDRLPEAVERVARGLAACAPRGATDPVPDPRAADHAAAHGSACSWPGDATHDCYSCRSAAALDGRADLVARGEIGPTLAAVEALLRART